MNCKNCGDKIKSEEREGHIVYSHATERFFEGDGGGYHFCFVKIIDCDKCKREHECGCTKPEPELKGDLK